MKYSRRHTLKSLLLGATATAAASNNDAIAAASQSSTVPHEPPIAPTRWARGNEGQRKADLGNGTFLNPIMGARAGQARGTLLRLYPSAYSDLPLQLCDSRRQNYRAVE
jgi:hypothetical protein